MSFAHPEWLWALLMLLPLFFLRIRAQLSNRRSLAGLVAPRLHPMLVSGTAQVQQWVSFIALVLGLSGIIVAMARPQFGYEEVVSYSEGRSIIIAIDSSRSMLANDLVPNRLERAKLAARDIVESMGEDRIGLMAFAGRAFMQAPLTADDLAIIESIEQVDSELIPRGGTNLTAAVALAMESFGEAESSENALIIFSDGEALEGQYEAEKIRDQALQKGIMIITIGVGTESGSIIPEPGPDGRPLEGAFITDERGQVVRSRLDATALRSLASTKGMYWQLGDRGTLARVVESVRSNLDATRSEDETKRRPIERFMWPLGLGLVFLIISHISHLFLLGGRQSRARRAMRTAVASLILITGIPSISQGDDGWSYMRKENYLSAIKQFEKTLAEQELSQRRKTDIHLGIGSAAYRVGDYEKAAVSYGEALIQSNRRTREQAHYNLGNTLFRKGETNLSSDKGGPDVPVAMTGDPGQIEATLRQWVGALEHYEAALEINHDNERARHNIEVIKRKMEELEAQQPPEDDPPAGEENQPGEDGSDQPEDQEEEPSDDQQSEENEPEERGDNDDASESESNDEDEAQSNEEAEEGEREDPSDDSSSNEDSPEDRPANEGPTEPGDSTEEEEPLEGEIRAEPENGSASAGGRDAESEMNQQTNPETGYSPSEARQLIEALADEDGELRPVYPRPQQKERYRNW